MSKNKNLPPLECRNYTMELRAEKKEKDYIIEGRPIVYNQVTNLGWCDEEDRRLVTPVEIFCCELAPYYWEAIKLRYPEYAN